MNILDRLALLPLATVIIGFPLLASIVHLLASPRWRVPLFAMVNVLGTMFLCIAATIQDVTPGISSGVLYIEVSSVLISLYCLLIVANYCLLRLCKKANGAWGTIAFAAPLLFLVGVKYLPVGWHGPSELFSGIGAVTFGEFFVGASYMAFRLSYLVREVQNDVVEMPTVWEYAAFAFFVPTIWVGPISPYSTFHRSLVDPDISRTPMLESLLRTLVGLTKYLFLATLINQFTYAGLLLDGHPHSSVDLIIAVFSYTAYLYCNFSGFCDIAIGVSGLMRIEVKENFDRPFGSRNLQEFWTRWHMTLSTWFREMMFTPLLKTLVRFFGAGSMNHMVALTILIVFLVVGMWHGTGLNFVLFGLAQGIGLSTVHYYNLFLKRRLGRTGYEAYRNSKLIRVAATAVTVVYFSISLFFFANSWSDMHLIFHSLV